MNVTLNACYFNVAPHMGAWIEIISRICFLRSNSVAPHMGAWIEILFGMIITSPTSVAPHMGAWIEIPPQALISSVSVSHPTWVRGLKFQEPIYQVSYLRVAPHMGAWIEIKKLKFIP